MNTLIQRIEAALASDDLHTGEIVGLIAAATTAASRLQNFISQLKILRDAVTEQERQAHAASFMSAYNEQDHFSDWATEPDHRSRSEIQKPPSKVFGFENEPSRRPSHQRR
jgi:hypothetical protein